MHPCMHMVPTVDTPVLHLVQHCIVDTGNEKEEKQNAVHVIFNIDGQRRRKREGQRERERQNTGGGEETHGEFGLIPNLTSWSRVPDVSRIQRRY